MTTITIDKSKLIIGGSIIVTFLAGLAIGLCMGLHIGYMHHRGYGYGDYRTYGGGMMRYGGQGEWGEGYVQPGYGMMRAVWGSQANVPTATGTKTTTGN